MTDAEYLARTEELWDKLTAARARADRAHTEAIRLAWEVWDADMAEAVREHRKSKGLPVE